MKKMALDYGEVRIGIALSDIMGIMATGLNTYTRKSLNEDIEHIVSIVNNNNVDTIVIGLPLNMDGTVGERAEKTTEFANVLSKNTEAKIEFLDERLTSVEASEIIKQTVKSKKKRQNKGLIDQISATIILQNYLDKKY